MSAVSDKVLNWLYSVLTGEYHDVNRTYSDAAETLASYSSLSPRTDVYTSETGLSALLLLISGTIPVQFRGTTYRFPIAVWVPHEYPKESPMVYVTPASGMLIRPGQHVAVDGRVYHPYLAGWSKYWDKSSINDFLTVLRGVFAKEPPVVSLEQLQPSTQQQVAPPPVPPPPDEWRKAHPHPPPGSGVEESSGPPPVPPKPGESPGEQPSSTNARAQEAPPVPPLPPLHTVNGNLGAQNQITGAIPVSTPRRYVGPPTRQSSIESRPSPFTPTTLPQIQRLPRTATDSPVSPIAPESSHQRATSRYEQPAQLPPQQPPYPQHTGPPPIQTYPPPYVHQPPPQPLQQLQQQQPPPPILKPTQPAIDLLTSPLDVTLPSQTGDQPKLPVPPVPPNPEKDALLRALSQALVAQTRQTLDSNNAAIAPLLAQQNALRSAQAQLSRELEELSRLDAAIDGNEHVLRDAMRDADVVIVEAAGRKRPEIDEVLCAPTAVGKQVYELVAEKAGCESARMALGRALDRGRVPCEVWARQVRGVAREEFLKMVVIRKIAKGLGLEMSGLVEEVAWR